MEKYCKNIDVVPFQKKLNIFSRTMDFLKPVPSQVSYYFSNEMKMKVKEITRANRFDVVQIEHTTMGQYADDVYFSKKILLLHDLHADISYRDFETSRGLFKRFCKSISYRKIKNYELKAIRKFNKIITVSERDKEILNRRLSDINISVFPFWKNMFISKKEIKTNDNQFLLFTGNMERRDNLDSATFFSHKIFPIVSKQFSDIKFYIVGGVPGGKFKNIVENTNTKITGYVDDIEEYYNRCKIFVAPIRLGAGIKFKIINAMAAAKPVVTTSLGNEGIGGVSDKDLVIADSSEEFAQKIIELLKNPKKCKEIGENGYEFFCKKFNNSFEEFEKIYFS